jgi:hypothetical protein
MIWGVHFNIGGLNSSVELYYDGRHSPVKIPTTPQKQTPSDGTHPMITSRTDCLFRLGTNMRSS